MRSVGPALELRVSLCAYPERMTRQLDELDQATVGRHPRADQPGLFEAARNRGFTS